MSPIPPSAVSTGSTLQPPARRGRLKVFLGMAPGVGKTFAMLAQAQDRAREGVAVLVGVVETHGRAETEALCEGLVVLPRRPLLYRGRSLMEFDLDAALALRPELLLVDEYAHSNAPGSRHDKRWQDVEELLAAGIDVWTTLNVQHLEGLNDVVWRITGVRQRETVPDSALSRAEEIELIDVTPQTLRARLEAGKVYIPETARLASERFFKPENLTALRELALRRAAQSVDDQLVATLRARGLEGPWPAGERILVLVGADAMAAGLVREGRRLAEAMDAPWTVAHVERPNRPAPGAAASQHLAAALELAERLGGSTLVLTGDDMVSAVLDHAHRTHVTQLVLGRSPGPKRWLRPRLAAALLDRARGVAVHVVTEAGADPAPAQALEAEPPPQRSPWQGFWLGTAGALAFVALGTGAVHLLDRPDAEIDLALVYILAVLAAGLRFGLWPAIVGAGAAAFIYNFFFLEPRLTVYIGRASDLFTFLVFFAVALAVGLLTGRLRDREAATGRRAAAVRALLAASRRLSGAAERQEAAQVLAEQLSAASGAAAAVLLPQAGEIALAAGAPALPNLSTADMAAARWAWERGERAGARTPTLPNAAWTFYPLQGHDRAGVAALAAERPDGQAEDGFVQALLDQGAVALGRTAFADMAAEAEALRRSDRLRAALLNSISHDLRTPLSTVLGSASTLLEYGEGLSAETRRDLLDSIQEEAERLSRYVGDLLDMTRLEGGALVARQESIDLRDVMNAAVARVARRLGSRPVLRAFPAEAALVRGDSALLEQAVVNVLENAAAYTEDGSRIRLSIAVDAAEAVLSIEDEGPGIPPQELERVFEKFRRTELLSDRVKGSGLGLAIARGFVEAMGGRITATSPIHNGRGTRLTVVMPREAEPAEEELR